MRFSVLLITFFYLSTIINLNAQSEDNPFQLSSGTLSLKNWTPSNNTFAPTPSINSLALKYKFEPDKSGCKLTVSMQWYLGDAVWFKREKYTSPFITISEIQHFSLVNLELSALAYNGSSYIGKIIFNVGKTPKAGGIWGNDIVDKRNWDKMFSRVSAYTAENAFHKTVTLKSIKIENITFGGGAQFKNTTYEKLITRAQEKANDFKFEEAIKIYGQALVMKQNDRFAITEQKKLQTKLYNFNNAIEIANSEFLGENYFVALEKYEEALRLIPNQSHPADRIAKIKSRINKFEKLDTEANNLIIDKQNTDNLFKANEKFKEALEYLPIDKKEYINNKLEYIQKLLEENYTQHIKLGDNAFQAKNYKEAVSAYQFANHVFHDRPYPKRKIDEIEEIVLESINKTYTDEINTASRERDLAFESSAKAINQKNENCYLEKALFNECKINYFQVLKTNARKEMEAMLYNGDYTVATFLCKNHNCDVGKENLKPNARDYLHASERKHKLYIKHYAETYKNHRDEYLEKSIQINPKNPDAYVFKSQLVNSFIDKEILLNTALSYQKSHKEAVSSKNQIRNDFHNEAFEKVLKEDGDYFLKAIKNNLLTEITIHNGLTILEQATQFEKIYILDFLLKNKNSLSKDTYTNVNALLYHAIENKSDLSADFLIKKKAADPNASFVGKDPLIFMAVKNRDYQSVSLLVEAKTKLDIKNQDGESPLDIAVHHNYSNIAQLLLKGFHVDQLSDDYLFIATNNNSYELTNILIKKGMNINITDDKKNTPLHISIQNGFTRLAELFILKKAKVNILNDSQNSPLILAIKGNHADLSELLVEKGANINQNNNLNETPLFWAISNKMPKVISSLLHKGADVKPVMDFIIEKQNQKFVDNATFMILKFAIEKNRPDLTKLALDYKPDIGYENHDTYPNMLRYAIQNDNIEIFKLLTQKDLDRVTELNNFSALHIAIDEKNLKFTKYLLDKLANLKSKDKTGASPLIHAVKVKFVECIELLVRKFNINYQDYKQMTPLHHAVDVSNAEIVTILLNHNANKAIKDYRGWTPKKLAKKKKLKQIKKLL